MTIKESVMSGIIPEDLRIVDSHAHLGDGEQGALYIKSLPAEESIRLSRKIGIGAIVASSLKSLYGNVPGGNERMMEFTRLYPGYVYASLFYDPKCHDQCMEQMERFRKEPGFVGIKIHPRDTGCSLASHDYDRLYEIAVRENLLVSCHTWDTEPANRPCDFEPVLERYPELRLQLCHIGGTYRGVMDSVRLANRFPNVYLDFNGTLYSSIWLEELVRLAPLERFVFGTDQTFNDPRIMVGRVLLADLDDELKRMILCDNFERIIGRKLV